MFQRKYFVISASAIYVILIVLFVVLLKEDIKDKSCDYDHLCVRFCCNSGDNCEDDFIRETFNKKNIEKLKFDLSDFRILKGQPKCTLVLKPFRKIWFVSVDFLLITIRVQNESLISGYLAVR